MWWWGDELRRAGEELEADIEKDYYFDWNIVDVDESHIHVTNKTNGYRYHISVICPAALYVDVFRILEDGTECKAFGRNSINGILTYRDILRRFLPL